MKFAGCFCGSFAGMYGAIVCLSHLIATCVYIVIFLLTKQIYLWGFLFFLLVAGLSLLVSGCLKLCWIAWAARLFSVSSCLQLPPRVLSRYAVSLAVSQCGVYIYIYIFSIVCLCRISQWVATILLSQMQPQCDMSFTVNHTYICFTQPKDPPPTSWSRYNAGHMIRHAREIALSLKAVLLTTATSCNDLCVLLFQVCFGITLVDGTVSRRSSII